ncbi:MAG: IS256 family transposase [Nannocystaceae bacterium]
MLKILEKNTKDEDGFTGQLDALVREGARRMLLAALEVEVEDYVCRHAGQLSEDGRRLVVRNGHAQARKITTGAGTMEVKAPRVNDKRIVDGERQKFTSGILPPYMRKSPKVAEVLPILYLRGLSTNDFRPALESLLGKQATMGLSATAITRLTTQWEGEHRAWKQRDLSERDYVYVWADGIHLPIRLEEDRLCLLVLIGARADGTKELIAVDDGYRESKESWASVLRSLRNRGLEAPVLAIGDGALGFWGAVRDVWPQTREQRCWVHKMCNILDKLPKRLQPKAKKMLREIVYADTKKDAEKGIQAFTAEFSLKHERAVTCLVKDQDQLLTLFDFPAEHWKHIRTTNVIESSFATVRLRHRTTKGSGTRTKGISMAFKLLDMAEKRWRKLDGRKLLTLVRDGVKFVDGLPLQAEQEAA